MDVESEDQRAAIDKLRAADRKHYEAAQAEKAAAREFEAARERARELGVDVGEALKGGW